jgi:hypothetical protein
MPPSKREQRYCSCLMKVRPTLKRGTPYAICTNSVYSLQKTKRTKRVACSKKYDFKKYTLKQLKAYAKEKKIKPINLKKKDLVIKLKAYAKKKVVKKKIIVHQQ